MIHYNKYGLSCLYQVKVEMIKSFENLSKIAV